MYKVLVAVVACLLWPAALASPLDAARLQQVLQPAWALTDLQTLMFAASSYKHLNLKAPDAKAACAYVSEMVKSKPSTEIIFQASATAEYLGCPMKASAEMKQTLAASVSEAAPLSELYHAVLASARLGLPLDGARLLALTQAALRRDDGVLSLGYAFHIGAALPGDASALVSRVEDALVQADELDGRMLQFEGGLSITALLIDGIYRLCEKAGRAPMSAEQAVKFATYLRSRRGVQVAKSVHYLLAALTTLSTNKYHLPVTMSVAGGAASQQQPLVTVAVADALGGAAAGGVALVADSVAAEGGASLAKGVPFKALGNGLFSLDVMALKPKRGFHEVTVSAKGGDPRLVGHTGQALRFKVLSSVAVEDVTLGTADADQTAAPVMQKVTYGAALSKPVTADRHQKLLMRFTVKDAATGQATQVQQAFVRLASAAGTEHIFVAEQESSGDAYKFELGLTNSAKQFGGQSGKYSVELILGDACISNPLRWAVGDVALEFPETAERVPSPDDALFKQPLPEISHKFAVAEPRPPAVVSLLFTALCAAPLLLLLVLWARLGVNLSNFPLSVKALGFHGGLGGILGLFVMFWLRLDMFTTLRYLAMVAVPTFYFGNATLSAIAAKRKSAGK